MPFELDDNGLSIHTLDEAIDFLTERMIAQFGDTINTGSLSFTGQIRDIVAESFHLVQEAELGQYTRLDPNGATGVWLDRIGALVGSTRRGQSFSTVEGLITFTGGPHTVENGDVIQHDGTSTLWEAIGGPYNGTDEAVAAVFQAIDPGPVEAIAGSTWTVITNPTGKAFTNPTEDATPGQLEESNPEYRRRQAIERYRQGQGPTAAISAVVQAVNTPNGRVVTAKTYHNPRTQPADSYGLPWKQTQVIVETAPNPPTPELQQDIWNALWSVNGGGTHFWGTYEGTVIDSEGTEQTVAFDVVEIVDLYIRVVLQTANTLDVDGPVFPKVPLEYATIVFDAVYARAQELRQVGRDALALDYYGVVNKLVSDGQITGLGNVGIGLSLVGLAGPFTADYAEIGRDQKIEVDTVNIQIEIDGTVYIG